MRWRFRHTVLSRLVCESVAADLGVDIRHSRRYRPPMEFPPSRGQIHLLALSPAEKGPLSCNLKHWIFCFHRSAPLFSIAERAVIGDSQYYAK
ncbi:hypothetical protein V1507DRAFT_455941 [Lipomyces tetrasporus]